jgi:hypothetical protein
MIDVNRRYVVSKVRELFGQYCSEDANIESVLENQLCPYNNKKCFKTRKSDSETSIGTCTVNYQNKDIIICPNRLTEKSQIFVDCLHLLTLHEPGNELYIIPEVTIPGGHVDFFLVSAKNKKVKDFVGIELQTMDTAGTVWPERQRLLDEHGIYVPKDDINNKKPFGMNWKMTAKTILVQMHHKAQTFENLNKHLVLIIQKPLYEYMRKEFSFSHIQGVRVGDAVHFHSYDVVEEDNGLHLALDTRVSTDTNGVAECLGLNAEANVELKDIIALLESKLLDEYRLTLIV